MKDGFDGEGEILSQYIKTIIDINKLTKDIQKAKETRKPMLLLASEETVKSIKGIELGFNPSSVEGY